MSDPIHRRLLITLVIKMAVELDNKDYIWSYIGIALSLASYVIMLPFVMFFLDAEMLGLWYVFQSLSAITVLFDFGFSTTFARNINYCWNGASKLEKHGGSACYGTEPNFMLMKVTMRACRLVFLIIALVALCLMLTVGTAYIMRISSSIEGYTPFTAWLLYAVAIFLNLFFGYYGSFLRGVGAIAAANKATVFARSTQIILTIVLLFAGTGLIGVAAAYLVYGTFYRLLAKRWFMGHQGIGEGLSLVEEPATREDVKSVFLIVWHNAWREGLVSLSNYLSIQACTIIASLYLGLIVTAVYSLGVQLATGISQLSAAMYSANQPVLQSAFISGNDERMRSTMSLIVVSYTILNVIGLLLVIVIGLPLLGLIRPEVVLGWDLMLGIGSYQFVIHLRNCYTSYFSCTNRIIYAWSFIGSSILCVLLAIVALDILSLGVWGLVGAQLVSQLVFNAWWWMAKAHREMRLSFAETISLGLDSCKKLLANFLKRG